MACTCPRLTISLRHMLITCRMMPGMLLQGLQCNLPSLSVHQHTYIEHLQLAVWQSSSCHGACVAIRWPIMKPMRHLNSTHTRGVYVLTLLPRFARPQVHPSWEDTWEEECPKSRNLKAVEIPELSVLTILHQFTSLPLRCASSRLLPAPVSYLLSKRCLLRFELHCPGCVELRCLQSHSLNVHL